MSNSVTIFNGQLPAHIAARGLSETSKALMGNAPTGKRISIEGGVFRMIAAGKEIARNKDRDMNIVVVRTAPNNGRIFYDPKVPYVKGQAAAPDCSSNDGIRPDSHAKKPQAKTCADCPQNVAGSGNGESRACRFNRRLAVVLEGDLGGDVFQLQLPATSIFGKGATGTTHNLPLQAYAGMLASNHTNIDDVVTKMEFDTDAATPKLTFTAVRFLTPQEMQTVIAQGETPEAEQAIGNTPYQMDSGTTTVAAPQAAPQAAPAKSGFEPVTEDEDEPAPAPVKPKVVKAVKPVAVADDDGDDGADASPTVQPAETRTSKMSNILSAWE